MVLHVILVKESGMYLSQIHMLATSFVGMILVFICLHLTSVKFQKNKNKNKKMLSIWCLKSSSPAAQDFIHFQWDFLAPSLGYPLYPGAYLLSSFERVRVFSPAMGFAKPGRSVASHAPPGPLCFDLRAEG